MSTHTIGNYLISQLLGFNSAISNLPKKQRNSIKAATIYQRMKKKFDFTLCSW